jgi:hypothetical protein
MKKSFFKICLIAFLTFWQTASSYIYQIKQYYNPTTKKVIFMLSDIHTLGSRQQNLEQFELFKKICELLKKKKIRSQILFEDVFAYTLEYGIEKETKFEKTFWDDGIEINGTSILHVILSDLSEIKGTINITNLSCDSNTWLFYNLGEFALKNTNSSVIYKSIDPRFIACIWRLDNYKNVKTALDILFLSNFKNLVLLKYKMYKDRMCDNLQRYLKKIYNEMKVEEFLQKIAECQKCEEKIRKVIDLEYEKGGLFFYRALEHEALLHMCFEHDFKYTFLLVGGAHADYLSQYMEGLGFELKEVRGWSTDVILEPNSNNLSDDLKQEMDAALLKIYNLIDQDVYDLPICKESEVGSGAQNTTSTTSSSNQYPVQQNNFNAYENDDVDDDSKYFDCEDDNSEEQKKVEAISGPTKKRKIDEDKFVTILKDDKN